MKSKVIYFCKFLAFTLLFFILSRSSINGIIFPFAFGMLYALGWCNQKIWILAPAFLIGQIANNYTFEGIISSVVTLSMLALPYFVHLSLKKPMKKYELFIFAFLSQAAFVTFSALNGLGVVYIIAHVVLGMGFLYLLISLFEPLLIRGLSYKLCATEILSLGLLLMTIGDGLDSIELYGFSFLKLFTALLILVISHLAKGGYSLAFASLMGLGSLLGSNNPLFMTPFIIWALASNIFKMDNRIFSAVSIILSEVLVTLYFNIYYSFSIAGFLPVVIASAIFLILPKKWLEQIKVLLTSSSNRLAVKNLLNRNREALQHRLEYLSEVFFDMNCVFKKLIKKNASEQEVKLMLYDEIKNVVCKGCPEQKHCHRTFCDDTRKTFVSLISIALERGRITLLDLPSYLSSRCGKANILISEINTLTKQYKSYSQLTGNVDMSKLLISDQLEGMAGLMKTLASEVDTMISIDNGKEEKLINELSANNIICYDAIIYEKDVRSLMATLVVRDEDVNKMKLQNVTSKICGQKLAVYDVKPTEKAGLMSVSLKSAPMFDCIFGIASQAKSGSTISGDRHSIERLDGDKFIFAICDGMGSGEKAGEKAETAIGLIENFYKAGFDSEIILSSVNKLLNLEREEIFSSIDICVIDLKNGVADFVKMGSASSYIRGEEGCDIIECSSLPVGVLDNIKALTKKVVLKEKDFVVLCSDGVNDAFGSDGEFKDFLLTIKTQNPQEKADAILKKAISINNGYAVDDMTVIVVKIF